MLEILFIIALTSRVGRIVEAKGLASGGYKWGAVGLWFGGEIAGVVVGSILLAITDININCLAYLAALLGAGIGAWVAITIAKDAEPMPGYPREAVPPIGEPPQNPR
jgi:hypothetical protein